MLTDDERKLMALLNERIQIEQDSAKLMRLIAQLNSLLERAEERTSVLQRNTSSSSSD